VKHVKHGVEAKHAVVDAKHVVVHRGMMVATMAVDVIG
jgi:hypothetical protein